MKMPQLLILLLTILVHVGDGFPTERQRRDKHASWDDVNVVAHGLLQLGQGLKEHVDKTKAHMREVNSKLKAFNNTVAELEKKQQEQDEALRARRAGGEGEQERYRLLTEQAEEVKMKVGEVKKQTEDITSRMDRLEEVLTEPIQDGNDSEHKTVSFIQRLMISQNRRIDQLVEKIQQQQDKLEKQSLHLQALQTKIAHKRVKSHRRRDEEMALTGEAEPIQRESGLAQDCHGLFMRGQKVSGVYTIQPEGSQPFSVLCQMTQGETKTQTSRSLWLFNEKLITFAHRINSTIADLCSEGGWTIIQKRLDGSQNFNQLWESYKNGFGSLNGEFWLGLDNIHSLSKQGQYILQVELSDEAGQQREARYKFQLDGEEKMFALHLEQESPSGVQEDIVIAGASGLPFSTADRDNDLAADINCAQTLSGTHKIRSDRQILILNQTI
uniref:Angiopoietin-like 4 n=1 Tax=Nothobranchius korthausae TaxID=1143690 RepID=A0A1A8FGT0_9TELE